jgi:hypothetical protein
MYKKLISVITGLLLLLSTKAQQLTPQTINNAGSSKSAGGIILEDALGGLLISTVRTPTFMYTQGFLQPDAGTITSLPLINDVKLNSGAGIDNAGTSYTNGGIILEFTTGEFASITLNGGSNMLTQGILQPFDVSGTVPVTGLEFYARRIDNSVVQLNWKTMQEFNNKGFHIERKKENENKFTDIAFVNSKALNGNSTFNLEYLHPDNNSFTGTTYYRLRQEDFDGRNAYSIMRIVKGDVNKQVSMQVWPVPATGPVNILVNGLMKPDILMLFDMNGKLVKQQNVLNNTPVQINNLIAGTYIVRLTEHKDLVQKIIVQ